MVIRACASGWSGLEVFVSSLEIIDGFGQWYVLMDVTMVLASEALAGPCDVQHAGHRLSFFGVAGVLEEGHRGRDPCVVDPRGAEPQFDPLTWIHATLQFNTQPSAGLATCFSISFRRILRSTRVAETVIPQPTCFSFPVVGMHSLVGCCPVKCYNPCTLEAVQSFRRDCQRHELVAGVAIPARARGANCRCVVSDLVRADCQHCFARWFFASEAQAWSTGALETQRAQAGRPQAEGALEDGH